MICVTETATHLLTCSARVDVPEEHMGGIKSTVIVDWQRLFEFNSVEALIEFIWSNNILAFF